MVILCSGPKILKCGAFRKLAVEKKVMTQKIDISRFKTEKKSDSSFSNSEGEKKTHRNFSTTNNGTHSGLCLISHIFNNPDTRIYHFHNPYIISVQALRH